MNKKEIACNNWAEDYVTQEGGRLVNLLRNAFKAGFMKGMHLSEKQWIPCSEGLPREFDDVLCCTDEGAIIIACCYHYENGTYDFDGYECDIDGNVVAWMPLPEAYKEVKE